MIHSFNESHTIFSEYTKTVESSFHLIRGIDMKALITKTPINNEYECKEAIIYSFCRLSR